MKKKTTEIFIEIEETIQVEFARREKTSAPATKATKEVLQPAIDICPHCHRAIFEPPASGPEGDSKV